MSIKKMAKPKFSDKTKLILYMESGFICCNPECEILACSASSNPTNRGIGTGTCDHISTKLSDEHLNTAENGIFLCWSCHQRKNNHDKWFSEENLKRWKKEIRDWSINNIGKPMPRSNRVGYYKCPRCKKYTSDPDQLVCHHCPATSISYGAQPEDFKHIDNDKTNTESLLRTIYLAIIFFSFMFILKFFPDKNLKFYLTIEIIIAIISIFPLMMYQRSKSTFWKIQEDKIIEDKADQAYFRWKE